ncbi:flavohemoprotein [Pleurocapsa sp. CCALA 161]|uniref:globin family protein n=1 Tax=Pleurocapsa sp. CCALA 161 TaxID=2107688 RepID=UPI000D07650B|nr:globin family protein [Pleurocapsa sp. CCALA 161]PSB10933.1 flavohemoprotein [Pleurocapsa sp. CCALA 161]
MSLKVKLLEESFEKIKPQANEFVDSFYENLFTASPKAKPLFANTSMTAQKQKLLASLVLIVENLQTPDFLDDSLKGLGARHVKYGALPEHYPLVGAALLATFEQYLKSEWTPEVKKAWVDAYGIITEIMLDGADYSKEDIILQTPTDIEETSHPKTNSLFFLGAGVVSVGLILSIMFSIAQLRPESTKDRSVPESKIVN